MSVQAQSMQVCKTCKNTLPKTQEFFYWRSDTKRLQLECKSCYKRRARKNKYRRDFGLEYDEYLEAKKAQGNKCLICNVEFNFNHIEKTPNVDHCHTKGHVRGILCRNCNLGLGLFSDDIKRLEQAAKYLRNDIV